ncbi:SAM-dependent methyltransferase [Streptomyces zagrosensis]|uniref:Trans-aconitate methyltransferase n=1 Tax=Streptomyces zagrosensis TaxID=1042984 RepID=A0A7W9UX61_9ACTN|nr:SAM-dependent methyltransferase [Streptomyces zagrosensis]MBB5934620.1 trans-aconitate methyltransferase [Streptomyces zagrosensis]
MAGYIFRAEDIDTSKPHSARMYDYFLGGKTHYEVDALAAEKVLAVWPRAKVWARANRSFMHRSTHWLAAEAGIRQFLDIGTGVPTEPNLHQIAQRVAPDSRVVYADHDPIVLTYADALLRSAPAGRAAYLHADVLRPETIFDAPVLHDTIDLSQPVALSLNALLHFVPDEKGPYELVAHLVDQLAPGSYLALSHGAPDDDPVTTARVTELYRSSGITVVGRTQDQVTRFFDGLELVEPGVTMISAWKSEIDQPLTEVIDAEVSLFAGVARKVS